MRTQNSYPVPGSEPELPVALTLDQYYALRVGASVVELDIIKDYLEENESIDGLGVWVQYPERMMSGNVIWDIACVALHPGDYGQRIDEAGKHLSKYEPTQQSQQQYVNPSRIFELV